MTVASGGSLSSPPHTPPIGTQLLDRAAQPALAAEYLARAKEEPRDAGHLVALAEAVLEARHGDPKLAECKLVELAQHRLDQREHWRVTLLRAFAAFRRGEHQQAGALASRAFEQAARLGQQRAPLIRERAITEQLLGLAVGTGLPAALSLEAGAVPMSLALLGRFELTLARRPVTLVPGQEVRLLKYVAVAGGQVHTEQAIETIWPEAGRAEGRNRLRTVLHRLRASAGNVLARSADMLVLDAGLRVDLQEFLAEASQASALAGVEPVLAVAMARGAISRYRGDLLPEDRYEDWAERPRQRARQVMVDMLDLCAKDATERDDLDGLRGIVERAIELDPYDDARYLRVASALMQQGRRGEALSFVNRARSALAELGLDPPARLLDLEQSIVA